jgi:ubiquitin-protein ligase
MASSTTLRRLMKEYQTEQKQQEQQRESSSSASASNRKQAARDENIISLKPRDPELKDLLHWTATIRGPPEGFYEGEPSECVLQHLACF